MKKISISGFFVWIIYTLAVGAGLIFLTMTVSIARGYGIIPGIVAGVLVMLLLWLATGGIYRARGDHFPLQALLQKRVLLIVLECLVFLGALLGMIVLRINLTWSMAGNPAFEAAKVEAGNQLPAVAHRGYALYLYLLHGSILLFGNRELAGIVLQVILLAVAVFSSYFGIRRISGPLPAITVLLFLGFSPFMIAETQKLIPFLLVVIFYGIAVWCIGGIPRRMEVVADSEASEIRVILAAGYYFVTGILVGVCCYLDVAGITLLIVVTGVICSRQKGAAVFLESGVFVFGSCLLATVVSFIALHGGSSKGREPLFTSIREQLLLYTPENFRIPITMGAGSGFGEAVLLTGIAAMGVFCFWYCGRIRDKAIWLFAAVLLMGMQCMGMTCEAYSDGFGLLYLLCAAIAGCCIYDLFVAERLPKEEPDMLYGEEEEAEKPKNSRKKKRKKNEEDDPGEERETENPSSANYIENPLPLPKKHTPKVMDYDYEVADDDDYDIP